jgi:hypothetical protein
MHLANSSLSLICSHRGGSFPSDGGGWDAGSCAETAATLRKYDKMALIWFFFMAFILISIA